MAKAVLISIQPYWAFLIIAKIMGWDVEKEKTVEVRKNFPKDENWDKVAKIYCSKDKKSFAKIPKEYQLLMEQFLGKVIGEFVCDEIADARDMGGDEFYLKSCLTYEDWQKYTDGTKNTIWLWHISDLVIYDEPRELHEFTKYKKLLPDCEIDCIKCGKCTLTKPPQSWCYVEEVHNGTVC